MCEYHHLCVCVCVCVCVWLKLLLHCSYYYVSRSVHELLLGLCPWACILYSCLWIQSSCCEIPWFLFSWFKVSVHQCTSLSSSCSKFINGQTAQTLSSDHVLSLCQNDFIIGCDVILPHAPALTFCACDWCQRQSDKFVNHTRTAHTHTHTQCRESNYLGMVFTIIA